ncbi:hypothetical protein [Bacillus sp. B15-48]|uniref:hypothetical protein n=1 Tax=Bacillus sp. B15-48 TaxID=1548601 RepID=UPI00193EF75F|nr:hypothetical protein [Bacillus sp. B15-48]MBM4761746.1 hypothetical protein [Bacillus sp. B15-48]
MHEEMKYITKNQLIRNDFRELVNGKEYKIVDKIDGHAIYLDSLIQSSFTISKSGEQRIFYQIDGSPQYFSGLYSLYAIILATKKVTDRGDDFLNLEVIDETKYQEIIIEYFHEKEHTSGLELISTIEAGRIKLAKKIKDDLLEEAKHYNLIDRMDIFL